MPIVHLSRSSSLISFCSGCNVVERFTRISPDTLEYEFTANDPSTWTKPWTARLLLKLSKDHMYEYACQEGNYGLRNILSGARAKEAEQGSTTSGRK